MMMMMVPRAMMMKLMRALDEMSAGDRGRGGGEVPTCNWSGFSPLCAD